jgi:hypothetical protein
MSEVQRSECVSTSTVGGGLRECERCSANISHKKPQARYCSRECQHLSSAHTARDFQAELEAELRAFGKQVAYRHLNRDRYIGFDGKYEGPLNQCFTVVVALRKDHGYHPMPIDVHVKPVEPKFTQITPEDVDWCDRQQAFPHSKTMPHLFKSFCASCTEVIVDGVKREVRVTKGIYTTKDHDCCVRVLDLQGKLLEVKKK